MILLDELFLLDGLTKSEKAEALSLLSPTVRFLKGDVIYSADNFKNAIGVIIKGNAFAVNCGSSELYMKTFSPGSFFGAAAVFGGNEKYVSTIIAKTNVEVLFLEESELTEIFTKFPKASINYITFLTDKIRFLNTKLSLLSCSSAEDTLFEYFKSTADKEGNATLPKSMTLLSRMLGVSRASLYRCIDALIDSGKIQKENNIIKVIENEKNC